MGTEKCKVGSYKGSLKIAATADVVDAVFDVEADSLRVRTGSHELGIWPLASLEAEYRGDGVHIVVDGESVVVNVNDQHSFAAAITAKTKQAARPRRLRRRKDAVAPKLGDKARVTKEPAAQHERRPRVPLADRAESIAQLFVADNWNRWLKDPNVRWSIASAGVIALALLALFATNTLGMILVLLGMVALIVAALAVSDDLSAYRLVPNAITETSLVIIGAIAMVVGGLLMLVR